MHEYAFDIKMLAAIRVKAENEAAAREMLAQHLNAADANLGAWPDGSPILCEASIDGDGGLYEIDGVNVDDIKPGMGELFDADPSCEHDISPQMSGIKCLKCGGWFCY